MNFGPGVPYEIKPIGGLKASGGKPTCFPIGFPGRCVVNKLIVVQTDGLDPVDFTAALYNNESACVGQNESESDSAGLETLPPDLYRVTPDLAGSAGKLLYFSETSSGGHGFVMVNQDVNPSKPPMLPASFNRMIYLTITPAGSANNQFAVVIGAQIWE